MRSAKISQDQSRGREAVLILYLYWESILLALDLY